MNRRRIRAVALVLCLSGVTALSTSCGNPTPTNNNGGGPGSNYPGTTKAPVQESPTPTTAKPSSG